MMVKVFNVCIKGINEEIIHMLEIIDETEKVMIKMDEYEYCCDSCGFCWISDDPDELHICPICGSTNVWKN